MSAPVVTGAVAPAPRGRARLLAYSAWQFRDYAINIAIISIILFGLLGTVEVMQLETMASMTGTNRFFLKSIELMRRQTFLHLLEAYTTVGPIVALSGIISADRSTGYVRFLFAKPLNPIRFYVQSFVVRLIGYLAVGAVLLFVYRFFEPIADPSRIAAGLLLAFMAYGGMIVLASAFSKYDGLVTIAFLLLATVVWGKWEGATGVKRVVPYFFPPTGKFSDLNSWVCGLNPVDLKVAAIFPTKWVIWTVCYGAACLLLGLVVLRKRPLARA